MIFHDIGKIYKRTIDEKLISHYYGDKGIRETFQGLEAYKF